MMTEAPPAEAAGVPSTSIAEYSPVVAGLSELRRRYTGLAFDLTTTKGNAEARQARQSLVKLRTSLEDKRKEIKAPALARARAIDDDARLIREAIEALENPIDEQIRADETRREAERAARIAAEQARIAAIRDRIRATFVVPTALPPDDQSAEELRTLLMQIEAVPVDESFEDLTIEAQQAKADALDALGRRLVQRVRIEEQRAEIARQQAALEEQRRLDDVARVERERVEAAARAERQRQEDVARAERERVEAEAKAQREAEAKAERDRMAAERAEHEAQMAAEHARLAEEAARIEAIQAEERRQREEVERQEREEREAVEAEERRKREEERVAEAAKLAGVIRRQAQIERAAPQMLAALFGVRASQAYSAMDVEPRDAVDAAIAAATAPV
jgi:colicin import membrane protein